MTVSRISSEGKVLIEPVLYHGDTLNKKGISVVTEFGLEINEMLNRSKFEAKLKTIHRKKAGIFFDLQVIVARKKLNLCFRPKF